METGGKYIASSTGFVLVISPSANRFCRLFAMGSFICNTEGPIHFLAVNLLHATRSRIMMFSNLESGRTFYTCMMRFECVTLPFIRSLLVIDSVNVLISYPYISAQIQHAGGDSYVIHFMIMCCPSQSNSQYVY
jgi:hypothetical protein